MYLQTKHTQGLSFRVYTTQDTVGVELGGALKNPLAVGAGMIEGDEYPKLLRIPRLQLIACHFSHHRT